jgi:D-sedoheptulose 7-phosphate isomerase
MPQVQEDALKTLFTQATTPRAYAVGVVDRMTSLLKSLDCDAIGRVIEVMEDAGRNGRTIFLVANGGSAAVASHFVNDLGVNCWVQGRPGFRVFCLTDNVASVTAVANDLSFNDIFARQLEGTVQPGDVVIGLSVSGNSENIIRAIEVARRADAVTIGLCGFDGGRLAKAAHHVIHIPSTRDEYGPVEDLFAIVAHTISGWISMRRGRYLSHQP